jgi:hypothetical protein
MYDSRRGIVGGLWRYQPRNVQFLMDSKHDVPLADRVTPLVHHCVVTRMVYGNDGYAPKSLPFNIDILLPDNTRVLFDSGRADDALKVTTDPATRKVLSDLKLLIETAQAQDDRGDLFALVLDSIWWRRCAYFATLGLVLIAIAFPVVHPLLDGFDKTSKEIGAMTGGAEHYLLDLFRGYIPSYAAPWVDAVKASPQSAANVIVLFVISVVVSGFLKRRIVDRARAAWNVQPKIDDVEIKRLRLAPQRRSSSPSSRIYHTETGRVFGRRSSVQCCVPLSSPCGENRRKSIRPIHPSRYGSHAGCGGRREPFLLIAG